jgi:hypothetical protein
VAASKALFSDSFVAFVASFLKSGTSEALRHSPFGLFFRITAASGFAM